MEMKAKIKYFKQYRGTDIVSNITADEAYDTLNNSWDEDFLTDILYHQKSFRLFTRYADVWTEKDGLAPIAGFYGVCE